MSEDEEQPTRLRVLLPNDQDRGGSVSGATASGDPLAHREGVARRQQSLDDVDTLDRDLSDLDAPETEMRTLEPGDTDPGQFVPVDEPAISGPAPEQKNTSLWTRDQLLSDPPSEEVLTTLVVSPPTRDLASPPPTRMVPRRRRPSDGDPPSIDEATTILVDSSLRDASDAPDATRISKRRSRSRRGPPAVVWLIGATAIGVALGVVGVTAVLSIDGDEPSESASDLNSQPRPVPSPVAVPVVPVPVVPESVPAPPAPPSPTPEGPDEVDPSPSSPASAMLESIRLAIDRLALEEADALLARASVAEIDPAALRRFEAQLAVTRGDGELVVEQLREWTERYPDDVVLWVSYGRALAQAERDQRAAAAFTEASERAPENAEALIGLALVAARGARMSVARRRLVAAREVVERDDSRLAARLFAAEAFLELELGRVAAAVRAAESALEFDERSAEASLLLARVDLNARRDPEEHLRRAVRGRAPAPYGLAMLAERVSDDEACRLAARYIERAPEGFDASGMRRRVARCP